MAMSIAEMSPHASPLKALGVRHAQAALLFLAMMLSYAMRVNMSLAIVTMASSDAFGWSVQIQSVVLSSFFWGYVVLQIPGGVMAARFGGARLILTCVGVNSLVTLLLPLAAFYGGWAAVCACRVLQGLAQGFLFPSTHALISKWVPLTEKSRIGTFIYAGGQFGTAIQLMVSGFVAAAWGWPAIFYLNGGLGVVWSIIYAFLGADSPQSSKIISLEERAYIQESLGHVGKQKVYPTPWCSIWTSAPFISLIIVHCGQNWGFWTLMTEMPSYMSNVLGVNIKSVSSTWSDATMCSKGTHITSNNSRSYRSHTYYMRTLVALHIRTKSPETDSNHITPLDMI